MASSPLPGGAIRFEISAPPYGGDAKSFCEERGSRPFGRAPGAEEFSIVRMAAIDGDPCVRPAARQFVAFAADWEPIPDDGLPPYDGLLLWR